jgi:hypothetical protein
MPLVTSWANRGDAILEDRSVEQRTYRVGAADDFIDYKEVVEKNVNKWVGFDEAAASAHIDTNQQPSDVTIANSWAMNEDQRVVGSYTITRSQEKKTVSVVGSTPTPTIGAVTFSVATNTDTTFPFNLTMSTSTAGAVIRYRVDSYNGSQLVTGSWQVSSGTSQTISLNTTNIARGTSIGGVAYHKYINVEAYAYRVLQTGTYEGPRSSRTYGQRVPNLVVTATLAGRAPTDIGHYLDHPVNGEVGVVIGKIDASVSLYVRLGYAESNTKNPNTAGFNRVIWPFLNSSYDLVSSSSFLLSRFFGIIWHPYAIFTGSSRDNNGFRHITRVQAYTEFIIDGVTYTSPFFDRIYYSDNDPF